MTWQELAAWATILSVGVTIGFLVFGRVYGFGRHMMKLEATAEAACEVRVKAIEEHIAEAIRGFREKIHQLEKKLLEFQLEAAEKYARRDSYAKIVDELKDDINKRMDRLEDLVLEVRNTYPKG